jgi:CobQ-like glutamine amidotransferase family enzyme
MGTESAVRIVLLFPDLLGTYGDRGNATVLVERLRARGHRAELTEVVAGMKVPAGCDIYLLGGGEDIAQAEASRLLAGSAFPAAVDGGAVVLAVCAGLQILGTAAVDEEGRGVSGLGVLDLTTTPAPRRAIGEIVTQALPEVGLADPVLTGFENHQGRTRLGTGISPLARVKRGTGNGDGGEGVVHGNIVGTYLHGPVLARNPALADRLLTMATGWNLSPLSLPDVAELRRGTIAAARNRSGFRRRVASALTPRRWLSPGMDRPDVAPDDDHDVISLPPRGR